MSEVTPYCDGRGKTEQVRDMFDNIAPAYDRLNRAMSFGLDVKWRRRAVETVKAFGARRIVDVATGTGDFAISLAKMIPGATVTGIDLSENMVKIGQAKVEAQGLADRVGLCVADCMSAGADCMSADAVTVAFGVRNFADIEGGLRAMRRMLRPGGMLCVLELSTPVNPIVKPLYRLYAGGIIPLMGRLMSRDSRAYSYLPESIEAVPQGSAMTRLMENVGFVRPSMTRLTLGVCTLYTAINPNADETDN